ncbi:MAG: nickel pincer cofactor biosynthesis protein LarB [Spirochaetia bacterium]|nr:nickel pincer cofactor biosynthesis protein LarB [Spirochaetia bacterium]
MDSEDIKKLLTKLSENKISVSDAVNKLKMLPFENIDIAHIDHHRSVRTGFAEVVLGYKKKSSDIISIINKIIKNNQNVLVTRLNEIKSLSIKKSLNKQLLKNFIYNKDAKAAFFKIKNPKKINGIITVITAGTADIPVAEEAAFTAECLGAEVKKIFDVGVAGMHRLLNYHTDLLNSSIIIAVAGMEGALPSVIAGITDTPVIAVPTSIGYGANFKGISALLTMLNSCASVTVVNIDNGFGAARFACGILNKLQPK